LTPENLVSPQSAGGEAGKTTTILMPIHSVSTPPADTPEGGTGRNAHAENGLDIIAAPTAGQILRAQYQAANKVLDLEWAIGDGRKRLGQMTGSEGRELKERMWSTARGFWKRSRFLQDVFQDVPDDVMLAECRTEQEVQKLWVRHGKPQPLTNDAAGEAA
jgi:hypothetical protein